MLLNILPKSSTAHVSWNCLIKNRHQKRGGSEELFIPNAESRRCGED